MAYIKPFVGRRHQALINLNISLSLEEFISRHSFVLYFAQHAQLSPVSNLISSFVSSLVSAGSRVAKRTAGTSAGPLAKMP